MQEESKQQEDSKAVEDVTDSMLSGTDKSRNASYKQVLNNSLAFINTDDSTTGCTEEVIDNSATIDSTKSRATWYDFTTSNIDMVLENEAAGVSQTKRSGSLLNINKKT